MAVPGRAGQGLTVRLEEAVSTAFALGRPLGPATFAARGELGRVWRLETTEGVWAVKELLWPQDPADAAADVAFQLDARAAGVNAPRPVMTTAGQPLATVDGRQVRVYGWHDLRPDGGPPPIAEVAGVLATIHGLRRPVEGPPHPWYVEPVGAAVWEHRLDEARRGCAPWVDAVAAVVPEMVAAESRLGPPPPDRLQRCHLDFNRDNVLLDGAGRVVVIDWENSGPGTAEQEAAFTLVEFAASSDEHEEVDRFVTAYREAGGTFEPDGVEVFAHRFAVEAHLLELFVGRWLDAGTPTEERSRATEAIAERLAAPLTITRAERLLAAVP